MYFLRFWGAQQSVGVITESCSRLTFSPALIPACLGQSVTAGCSSAIATSTLWQPSRKPSHVPVSKGLEEEEHKTDRQISYKMSRIFLFFLLFFPFLVLICLCHGTAGEGTYTASVLQGSPSSVWNLADEAETIDISVHTLIGTFQESEVCHVSG